MRRIRCATRDYHQSLNAIPHESPSSNERERESKSEGGLGRGGRIDSRGEGPGSLMREHNLEPQTTLCAGSLCACLCICESICSDERGAPQCGLWRRRLHPCLCKVVARHTPVYIPSLATSSYIPSLATSSHGTHPPTLVRSCSSCSSSNARQGRQGRRRRQLCNF